MLFHCSLLSRHSRFSRLLCLSFFLSLLGVASDVSSNGYFLFVFFLLSDFFIGSTSEVLGFSVALLGEGGMSNGLSSFFVQSFAQWSKDPQLKHSPLICLFMNEQSLTQ